jgi:hypothetical protein
MVKHLYLSGVLVVAAWLAGGGSLGAQTGAGSEQSASAKELPAGTVEVVEAPKAATAAPGSTQAGLPGALRAETSKAPGGTSSAPAGSSSVQAGSPSPQTGSPSAQTEKQKALAMQTQKLAAMAMELKASVDKTNKDILSWAVVQQAQQIEQYVHQLKQGEVKR